jgi:uncharacterized cofD-like protein/HAD superfamily hydrolase (TIGR01549 family)
MTNIVCLGGGTGQSEILRGLKKYDCNITAIVAVTDSGRSTGVIRNNFNTIAPGDIRNCITALSDSEELIKELFQYRFEKGIELQGMSFGNLFLTAMSKVKGDMFSAIKETSKILKIKGKVLPSTLYNTHICAELEDGSIVKEELNVRKKNKSKIKKIFLKDKDVNSPKEVIKAIEKADIITIGPGSLYTSVLVHFLIPNLKKAFVESKAKKIFVCNLVTQAGQTDNYNIKDHIDEIIKYAGKIDYVILNNKNPNKEIMKEYEKEGGFLLNKNGLEKKEIYKGIKLIHEDIIKKEEKKEEWNKVSSIRHDPEKTTKIIMDLENNLNKESNKKIKAVILAAGNSTRLRPFSFTESKTMIKFLGKPLLEYHVDECIKNGISDIAIIGNRENIKQIKDHFKNNKKIKYYLQKEQIGTANAVICAKEFIKSSYFILKFGDSIASEDETPKLISIFNENSKFDNKNPDVVLTLKEVNNPEEYGIAKFENDKVIEIIEKPKENFPSKYALVGFSIMNGDLFIEAYEKIKYEKIVPPQQYILAINGKSAFWISDAKRLDVGRAWNLLEANKILIDRFGVNNKNIDIPKSSKVSETTYLSPNAIISKNVIIEGYCSISGFIGEGTKIVDSFIMEGTRIGRRCHIETSVIGKNNNIGNNFITKSNGSEIKVYVKGRYVNPTIKKAGIFTGENVTIMDKIISEPGKMIFPNKIIREDIKEDKLIRAILFDADNTLYDTKNIAKKADMEAIEFLYKEISKKLSDKKSKEIKNRKDVKDKKKSKTKEEIYNEWNSIVKKLMHNKDPKKRTRKYSYNEISKKYELNLYEKMYNLFLKKLIEEIKIMPNLYKIFELRSLYKMAVFSEDTYETTIAKLKKVKIEKFFDLIITSDKIGEMKPSLNYYKKVFKEFDIEPSECLVIGDNFEKDLKIAKDLGAITVLYGKNDERTDFSIYDYNELITILRRI